VLKIHKKVGNKKWLISGVYRPQTINDKTFNDDFIKTCDKITTKYDNFMYIGDLNYDFLDEKIVYLQLCIWELVVNFGFSQE
jgi:hypothetical protein